MSKNWGKTPITNADKRAATQTRYLVEVEDGHEERIDRRPLGKVERFVDKAGHVIAVQLYSDGDPRRGETEIRKRAQEHRKGHIEFSKCPLKHGTKQHAIKDFAQMPASLGGECKHDPKVMERKDGDLYAKNACPHIEWLIADRRKRDAADYARRNAHVAALERKENEKRELADMQAQLLREQLAERAAKVARKPKDVAE